MLMAGAYPSPLDVVLLFIAAVTFSGMELVVEVASLAIVSSAFFASSRIDAVGFEDASCGVRVRNNAPRSDNSGGNSFILLYS